jgi:hypothetical protein
MISIKSVFPVFIYFLIAACGSKMPLMTTDMHTKALSLKTLVAEQKIQSPDVRAADSLFALAQSSRLEGKEVEAHYVTEQSMLYYKMVLIRHTLDQTRGKIQKLEDSLEKAQEQLKTYRQVISKLKSMKKP